MGRVEHPDERSLLHSTSEQFRRRYVLRSGRNGKRMETNRKNPKLNTSIKTAPSRSLAVTHDGMSDKG